MRWAWFGGAVLVAVVIAMFVALWIPVPSPGLMQPTDNLDLAMANHATQFGIWMHFGVLAIAGLAALLLFWSFYLQLFHVFLREASWLGRSLLCYVLAVVGGFLLLYRAVNWALQQRETTLLRQALNDIEAAKQISYSGAILPVGWRLGIHIDMLAICLVGIFVGYWFYVGARKALTL